MRQFSQETMSIPGTTVWLAGLLCYITHVNSTGMLGAGLEQDMHKALVKLFEAKACA